MTIKYAPRIYAPIYGVPAPAENDFRFYGYDQMKLDAGRINGYCTFKLNTEAALQLAARSPYPDAVKVAVMKQVANTGNVTLEQMRIILGWAARRAQHTGR